MLSAAHNENRSSLMCELSKSMAACRNDVAVAARVMYLRDVAKGHHERWQETTSGDSTEINRPADICVARVTAILRDGWVAKAARNDKVVKIRVGLGKGMPPSAVDLFFHIKVSL